ncbi:MAG: tyrosine-type recombinase/integrase [Sciscionella sp.]
MPATVPEPWGSLITEWVIALRSENKSARTIRGYTDPVCWFHSWLHQQPEAPAAPEDVGPLHVRAWIAHRIEATSPGNAHNNYRALQQWFRFLVEEEETTTHPMAGLKPSHVPDKPPPITSDEVMRAVLEDCAGKSFLQRRDTAIIRLIWDTGARLSEIANLECEHVDLTVCAIHVLGKGGKPRSIPFSAKTAQALSRYKRVRAREKGADSSYLWLADRNKGRLGANGIRIMLARRGRAAGVNEQIGRNLHAHLGRHYMAHHAKASGIQDGDLMLLAGWTSPQMVERYGRSEATERARAAARNLRLGDRL